MALPFTSVSKSGATALTRSPKMRQISAMCSSCMAILFLTNSAVSSLICVLLYHPVDDHAAHGYAEFVEPVDEPGDDGDGKALRQGHEKEGRECLVREELLGALAILSLKPSR